jgi:hypothetical protein
VVVPEHRRPGPQHLPGGLFGQPGSGGCGADGDRLAVRQEPEHGDGDPLFVLAQVPGGGGDRGVERVDGGGAGFGGHGRALLDLGPAVAGAGRGGCRRVVRLLR